MKLKALVIEDSDKWLKIIVGWLTRLDFQVLQAETYKQAMDIIANDNIIYDVVVSDIVLDENDSDNNIDGIRILQYLVDQGRLKKGIVITSHPTSKTKRMAKKLKVSYLKKGEGTYNSFTKVINKFIREHHVMRMHKATEKPQNLKIPRQNNNNLEKLLSLA